MSENSASNFPEREIDHSRHGDGSDTEHVQRLSWALLDDLINDEELSELGNQLSYDDNARQVYARCVQLHADLHSAFATKPSSTTDTSAASKTPVLGFLHSESQLFGLPLPPTEDLKS